MIKSHLIVLIMQIDHIELKNFKNYADLKAGFKSGVNLFVGANGSGKTSLLEGLCVAVGAFFGSQEQKMQRVIEFDEIKITQGKREPLTTVSATWNKKKWSRTIKSDTKTNDSKDIRSVSEHGREIFESFNDPQNRDLAPILAYYSTQRLFNDAKQSQKQRYDAATGRRNGFLQCLEERAIKPLLMEWLGNAVTRRATLQIKDIEQVDNVLENVEKAIRITLIDFLELPDDFSLKIYQDPDYGYELFLEYDNDHCLPLSYYSDGFRNLLFLIIDLVWRASQLNSWLSFNDLIREIEGVVMIDEVDLHLHPRWQAKAIPLLQQLFPQVQFFITTHSPTVVANFTKGTLYIIQNDQINACDEKYFGKEINSILRNILGASDRHVPTQIKLNKLFDLIDIDAPSQEIESLLDELIASLGVDDFDIQRILSLISWNKFKNLDPNAVH